MNIVLRPFFELFRAIALGIYYLSGWKFEGDIPQGDKFMVVAAPHTSNWDLPMMLMIALHFRKRLHWVGKAGLFKPPFGWFMKALGGVPVQRSTSVNFVDQVVAEFNNRDHFIIGILPEGTRAKVTEWKSGFWHIAKGAQVPIAYGFVDYARKVGGVGGIKMIGDDYERDLAEIQAFYAGVTGKHPEQA